MFSGLLRVIIGFDTSNLSASCFTVIIIFYLTTSITPAKHVRIIILFFCEKVTINYRHFYLFLFVLAYHHLFLHT